MVPGARDLSSLGGLLVGFPSVAKGLLEAHINDG